MDNPNDKTNTSGAQVLPDAAGSVLSISEVKDYGEFWETAIATIRKRGVPRISGLQRHCRIGYASTPLNPSHWIAIPPTPNTGASEASCPELAGSRCAKCGESMPDRYKVRCFLKFKIWPKMCSSCFLGAVQRVAMEDNEHGRDCAE